MHLLSSIRYGIVDILLIMRRYLPFTRLNCMKPLHSKRPGSVCVIFYIIGNKLLSACKKLLLCSNITNMSQ
ncbi:hypothetical protein T12_708 [Trichinella patagoniensis]|uniref:Uncharacterized protein n=1 Tax=Trichinella patagoniensis TaxID=990121 RepID=A0A0V1A3Z5_9BILA|nr:hypothetical protein T12_708 [Trichinella patagoniensis]